MDTKQRAAQISSQLLAAAKDAQFAGDDPFDGLNATLFRLAPSLQDSVLGLAWTQVCKRSAINFRRLTGVPKQRNPKGVALFISGMLLAYQRTGDEGLLSLAKDLGNWLLTAKCDSAVWGAPCWGYHFPWKARAFFVPLGTPNLITTVYVSQALYQLGSACGLDEFKQVALASADFIVNTLFRSCPEGDYFRYIPGEDALVHNANLWAVAWVTKSAHERNLQQHVRLAERACRTSLAAQREDGSWAYGTLPHHQFIDGFHTGYNLETLNIVQQIRPTDSIQHALQQGLAFYTQTLFDPAGRAKYYHNKLLPMDTHNFAQAVVTLRKLTSICNHDDLLTKVVQQCITELYLPNEKRFGYQKTKWSSTKIDYIRWTQSWAYYALNIYLNHKI